MNSTARVFPGKWKGKSRREICADWHRRGFSCEVWIDPPGRTWEGYVHDVDELVTPLDGPMEFEVEGQVYHLEPGDECFIPAGAVHSARNRSDRTVQWLYGYARRP